MPAQEAKKTPGDPKFILFILLMLMLMRRIRKGRRAGSESDLGTVRVGKNWCR